VAKAISGELQITELNGFAWSEIGAGQVDAVGNEGDFR
jgi:hypothetical protein